MATAIHFGTSSARRTTTPTMVPCNGRAQQCRDDQYRLQPRLTARPELEVTRFAGRGLRRSGHAPSPSVVVGGLEVVVDRPVGQLQGEVAAGDLGEAEVEAQPDFRRPRRPRRSLVPRCRCRSGGDCRCSGRKMRSRTMLIAAWTCVGLRTSRRPYDVVAPRFPGASSVARTLTVDWRRGLPRRRPANSLPRARRH